MIKLVSHSKVKERRVLGCRYLFQPNSKNECHVELAAPLFERRDFHVKVDTGTLRIVSREFGEGKTIEKGSKK